MLRARSEVKFRCHVRGFARVVRLVTALYIYTTRIPYGYEKATISLYARVVITLVSSTLRDISFYIIYLEVPLTILIVPPIRSLLDTIDVEDEQAKRVLRILESQDTPIDKE